MTNLEIILDKNKYIFRGTSNLKVYVTRIPIVKVIGIVSNDISILSYKSNLD